MRASEARAISEKYCGMTISKVELLIEEKAKKGFRLLELNDLGLTNRRHIGRHLEELGYAVDYNLNDSLTISW